MGLSNESTHNNIIEYSMHCTISLVVVAHAMVLPAYQYSMYTEGLAGFSLVAPKLLCTGRASLPSRACLLELASHTG